MQQCGLARAVASVCRKAMTVAARSAGRASSTQITRALLQLRELILAGEFGPRERLSELRLVARIGVSRTPLRLALQALEHEGLLRALPGGGYAVRAFTKAEISDAIELRGVLEGTAARFAAERGARAAELQALRRINGAIEQLVHRADDESFERYVELNRRFHARLVALARSRMLEAALERILSLPFAGPSAFVLTEARLPQSREILVIAHRHHVGLVDAIAARQGARAESLAREHARIALTNLEIVLRHREVLAHVPGASLISAAAEGAPSGARGTAR
jgi:GntR family transcriptional regulator of vanillate catabolism